MAISDGIQYAGEYKLLECNLLSSTGVVARLDTSVIEINIFENISTQGIMCSLVIVDNNNLVMNMPIVGQEFVTLKIKTPGLDVLITRLILSEALSIITLPIPQLE